MGLRQHTIYCLHEAECIFAVAMSMFFSLCSTRFIMCLHRMISFPSGSTDPVVRHVAGIQLHFCLVVRLNACVDLAFFIGHVATDPVVRINSSTDQLYSFVSGSMLLLSRLSCTWACFDLAVWHTVKQTQSSMNRSLACNTENQVLRTQNQVLHVRMCNVSVPQASLLARTSCVCTGYPFPQDPRTRLSNMWPGSTFTSVFVRIHACADPAVSYWLFGH